LLNGSRHCPKSEADAKFVGAGLLANASGQSRKGG
jgi:hypothetical protein